MYKFLVIEKTIVFTYLFYRLKYLRACFIPYTTSIEIILLGFIGYDIDFKLIQTFLITFTLFIILTLLIKH